MAAYPLPPKIGAQIYTQPITPNGVPEYTQGGGREFGPHLGGTEEDARMQDEWTGDKATVTSFRQSRFFRASAYVGITR
jgi:hypothetical protein